MRKNNYGHIVLRLGYTARFNFCKFVYLLMLGGDKSSEMEFDAKN